MKKVLIGLMALAVIAGSFVGCGKSAENAQAKPTAKATIAQGTQKPATKASTAATASQKPASAPVTEE